MFAKVSFPLTEKTHAADLPEYDTSGSATWITEILILGVGDRAQEERKNNYLTQELFCR